MINDFRKYQILSFFQEWSSKPEAPLDAALNFYLRNHPAIGSKDRKVISETIFQIVRWKSLIDGHLSHQGVAIDDENRLNFFLNNKIEEARRASFLKPHEALGFPEVLYHRLISSLGKAKAETACIVAQSRSPIFVRTNLRKTTREALFNGWKSRYDVSLCQHSKSGIIFHEKINFFILPEFKKGLFEIQDEASQLVGDLIDAKPGQEVLDYCAGAGGKTLAFAPKMEGKGQIFLYDIRAKALMAAKTRLRRGGIQNAQIVTDEAGLKRLKKRMDWVILDVPCTGSGTLRRNPDQRWRYSDEMLERLIAEQRKIFSSALEYLSAQGKIVYSTCSILPEENEHQVEYFCKTFGCKCIEKPFSSFPEEGKMDGFFAATILP